LNIYGLLTKLVEKSELGEGDRIAALEVIRKLDGINALGSAARSMEVESTEPPHTHVIETQWDKFNAGKLIDVCRDCGERIGHSYDPKYSGGNRLYFNR
jgi:hypothetical protein